jgi:hypothetical protein
MYVHFNSSKHHRRYPTPRTCPASSSFIDDTVNSVVDVQQHSLQIVQLRSLVVLATPGPVDAESLFGYDYI